MLGMTAWILLREFQWPQATTLCLHTVVMYMKMHSYLTCNYEFELGRRELERVQNDISILSGQISSGSKERPDSSPSRNGRSLLGFLFGSYSNNSASNVASDLRSKEEREVKLLELREHEERLNLNLKLGPNSYPETFTLANFCDFLLVPTLVYELYYPREERPVRIRYIVEKVMGALGIFATLYFILEHYIYPVLLESHNITLVECILQLLIPMLMSWLLVFYIIFECVCNTFAEITGFADRQFYDYWWNSCSFDEFARTWNKPVHEFLLRHIYLEAIDSYKLSKHNATFLTFLFSSCLHEFAVAVVARKVKMFFFFLQMTQIPLIWIGRATYIKQKPVLGNVVFWLSLISGLPLLASLYTREEFLRQQGLVGDIWFWPEGVRF
jgi:sterol O-acyltransferase